ncbi:MAG: hypothetical protein ACYTE8_03020 [Planctomycetota bacterium]|jgi:hypothetical protein
MKHNSMLTLMLLFSSICLPEANALTVYNDGGTHNISTDLGGSIYIYNTTTVNLLSGGSITGAWVYNDGQLNVSGGTITGSVLAYNSSTVDVSSGEIKFSITAYDNSQVFVSDGTIKELFAYDNGYINWSGGYNKGIVYSYGTGGHIEISGGELTASAGLYADEYGTVTIYGTGFNYPYGEISAASGTLTGTLSNGDSINNSFSIYDENASIVLVASEPDPATFNISEPNGGEALSSGSVYDIVWETEGVAEWVVIEYSTNNGTDWVEIETIANTGICAWEVPDVNSQQCLVRVSETNSDTSDAPFTIYVCTLKYDMNNDCFMDYLDFALWTSEWLECGNPFDPNCI